MAAAAQILATARTVLVVDWPSRDVPDTLARGGFEVVVHGGPGPEDYTAHEMADGDVVVRQVGRRPSQADLVYSHRPLGELSEIVDTARDLGARAVWIQSGVDAGGEKDPTACWMPAEESTKARAMVEAAGMAYVDDVYIVDAVGALGSGTS